MEKPKLTKYQVCAIFGLCLSILGVIFLEFIIPSIAEKRILKSIALKEGWPMRKTWSETSYSYDFHAYMFNITNPDEISNGKKPIVKEIGPYIYEELRDNVEVEDHEEDDTVSFKVKFTYFFNATKSYPLSDEDELTLTHYLMMGTACGIIKTRPSLMPIASKAVDSVYNKPKSLFVTTKVKTYMFDGFELNCEGAEDFFAKAMCNDIRGGWYEYSMMKLRENVYASSTMATYNDTLAWAKEIRINRGIRDMRKIGEVVEFDHANNFSKWDDEKCDKFVGTDGTMFPPFLNRNDDLHVSFSLMRRVVTYQYDSDVVHDGLECFRYTASVGINMETNPDDKCYCSAPDRCLKDGMFDPWKSHKFVTIWSNPHFYRADPYYNDITVGCNPDKGKHLSIIDVHPLTGRVVSAKFRMQWSVALSKQPKYRLMKNMVDTVLPLGWFEGRFTMPESDIKSLKKLSHKIAMEKFFVYVVIAIGLILFGVGVGCMVYRRKLK